MNKWFAMGCADAFGERTLAAEDLVVSHTDDPVKPLLCICIYLCFYHVIHFPFSLANTATLCGINSKSIFSMEFSQPAPKFCKISARGGWVRHSIY